MTRSNVSDGVREFVLRDWTEFAKLVADEFIYAPAYVYRGQAAYEWKIESSLDRHERSHPKRKNLAGGTPEYFDRPPLSDDEHLAAFRRAVRGRRGRNPRELSEDELWALGQHHGLKTPLLDWARSPYVALFFAFEEERVACDDNQLAEPEFRGVYALSTSAINPQVPPGDAGSATARNDGAYIVSTIADENYRLISQGGLLLKMPRHTDVETDVRRKFIGDSDREVLIKIKIPNQCRHECLAFLNKMNINRLSLFPDIDGAARFVNSLWQDGQEDSIAYI